jgi:hypothetical protein
VVGSPLFTVTNLRGTTTFTQCRTETPQIQAAREHEPPHPHSQRIGRLACLLEGQFAPLLAVTDGSLGQQIGSPPALPPTLSTRKTTDVPNIPPLRCHSHLSPLLCLLSRAYFSRKLAFGFFFSNSSSSTTPSHLPARAFYPFYDDIMDRIREVRVTAHLPSSTPAGCEPHHPHQAPLNEAQKSTMAMACRRGRYSCYSFESAIAFDAS